MIELLLDIVGLDGEPSKVVRNRNDNLRGVVYDGSDRILGERTALITLSMCLEGVSLLRK